jgi:hypothetical protein
LAHNYYAGRAYHTDSLRSATFVHKWGFTPSILVHLPYNEVAQPEDHIPQRDRWFRIGPYDIWALAWAYRPIPDASTPEAELPTLERWRASQDTAAYLRIQVSDINGKDGDQAWGGDDIIRATDLKARNSVRFLQRLTDPLNKTQLEEIMKFFGARGSMDSLLAAAWQSRMLHVATLLGGRVGQPPYPRDPAAIRIVPIDAARQLQAVRFFLAHALYGQDPVLQIQKKSINYSSSQEHRPAADSVPVLFDTSAAGHSPTAILWQQAQYEVLSGMVSRVPKMPPAAWPEACHYLSDAVRALTNVESRATPSLKDEAKTLRIALTPPSICPSP